MMRMEDRLRHVSMSKVAVSALAMMLASTGIVVPLSASAQVASTDIRRDEAELIEDTIAVVGQRRAYWGNLEFLEETASNQTLGLELLRDAGVLALDEALDLSASVSRQNNFGGLWNSFSIRGFSGDINLPGGFLVNGFNAGRGFGGPYDLAGVESVEVLKGPRSALFGRGEPGGTINIVTKRPEFVTGGQVRASYGRFDFVRLEADAQTSYGSDIGARLVGFYEGSGSFRGPIETSRRGVYPSVAWNVTEATGVTYELEYTEQRIPFDRGVVFSERFGFSPRDTFTGEPGDGPIRTSVIGHQFELQHNFSDNWSLLAGLGYRVTSLDGSASENNFAGRQTFFLDGRTISRFFRFRDFDSDYLTLRAELAGEFDTGWLSHRLVFGADYDRFNNSLFILRYRPSSIPSGVAVENLDAAAFLLLDAINPVFGQFPQPMAGPNTDRSELLQGYGVYFQDQIGITDRLQIRIGGRFDSFAQDLTNKRADPATTISSSDTRFSPQLGAVYALSDGLSVYAAYGEGFRQQTGVDFEGNQFAPNITQSAEFGLKAELDAFIDGVSGSVTVAAFEVNQSNILVNDDRPEAVSAGFFSFAAGKALSRGIELDGSVLFENGIGLWLSYAYTDAQFRSNNLDADFGAQIEIGDPLINSPMHQFNFQASREFRIGSWSVQTGGGVLYTGERNGFTGFDFILPAYTTVRAFAQIESVSGLSLRVDIDNILDEVFYTNSYADVWVQPGAPRSFRLTATYAFGSD